MKPFTPVMSLIFDCSQAVTRRQRRCNAEAGPVGGDQAGQDRLTLSDRDLQHVADGLVVDQHRPIGQIARFDLDRRQIVSSANAVPASMSRAATTIGVKFVAATIFGASTPTKFIAIRAAKSPNTSATASGKKAFHFMCNLLTRELCPHCLRNCRL